VGLEQLLQTLVGVLLPASDLADQHQPVAVEDGVDDAKRPNPQPIYGAAELNGLFGARFVEQFSQRCREANLIAPREAVKLTLSARL